MKQNDIALLILIVFVTIVASAIVGGKVIRPAENRSAKVEVVEKISGTFQQPDPAVFNDRALNPTKQITIGGSSGNTPIGSSN